MKDYGEIKQELRRRVLEQLNYSREQPDNEVMEIIDEVLLEEQLLRLLPVSESHRLRTELFYSLRRLDILQSLIEDPEVTEIMINGPNSIFVERAGHLQELDIRFESEEKLQDVIQQIVAGCNRIVNEASPIVDARLSGGARVNIVMNPIALNGPIVTIRRFPDNPITLEELIRWESLSREAAEFLQLLVRAGYNIFISGGTGSGKTTFLNVLS